MNKKFFLTILLGLTLSAVVAQKPELIIPIAHTKKVTLAQFSPDGKYAMTASREDFTAKIWEVSSGKLLHDLKGHTDDLESAQFSPDGKYLVTASEDKTAKIWEMKTGKLLQNLSGHTSYVTSAQFSPDGKYVVTASFDNKARIWETTNGRLVLELKKHSGAVTSAQFSPNGRHVVTGSWDKKAIIWEATNGEIVRTLSGHDDKITIAQFSHDGRYIVTASDDKIAKIWDASSGKLLHNLQGHSADFTSAQFSPDGQYVLTSSKDKSAKIWESSSGKLLHDLKSNSYDVTSAQFSQDGKFVVTASLGEIKIWDVASGTMIRRLVRNSGWNNSTQFSPDGKYVIGANEQAAGIWETNSGKLLHNLTGSSDVIYSAQFSDDGKYLLTVFLKQPVKILEASSGKLLHELTTNGSDCATSAQFCPNGTYVVTVCGNKAKIWDVASGKLLHDLTGHTYGLDIIKFSPDGKYLVTTSVSESTAKIWDVASGKLLHDLTGHTDAIFSLDFSPDPHYVVTGSRDNTVKVWDVANGKVVQDMNGHSSSPSLVRFVRFSPDGKYVVSVGGYTAKIREVATGKSLSTIYDGSASGTVTAEFSPDGEYVVTAYRNGIAEISKSVSGKSLHKLKGHTNEVKSAQFCLDGKYVLTESDDNTIKIWSSLTGELVKTLPGRLMDLDSKMNTVLLERNSILSLYNIAAGSELLSWTALGEKDWVATHPFGLFDASPDAMTNLYFKQGMDIIQIDQLKERYYEPGLWKKVISGEKLRNVVGMESIELPPDIQVGQVDDKGYLPVELTNRGGGIGEVTILINGKEVIADARPMGYDSKTDKLSLKVYIGNNKAIVKGTENYIAVKAWNEGHWVVSRGALVTYSLIGNENTYKPAIHIITSGVSDYTGTELDLKYAAKDAEDVNKALQLGAKKLFGADKSYVYNLTTSQPNNQYPTKANILKAFEKVSSVAHPLDIVVVYLSGHGINHGGQDGDWYYLTQDAYTSNSTAYNDPEIRRTCTLSSNELVELFKKVPALKQVLMIDACASGKVVENLMAQKNIESTTLRALDRMRDRTGLHIITGCTADAVSYEASKYGQGVLTYSLIEGIRGAALREDQFVDVNKLFQYAHDRVPTLAEGIGGIQTPQVFSPQGGQSFDIGLLTEQEKKAIPITKIRPVYIRSAFIDDDQLEDALQLSKKVDEALNEAASKGTGASLIFVDVREYPEGCKLSGKYKQEGGIIKLKLRKKCEGKDETLEINGKSVEEVRNKVINNL